MKRILITGITGNLGSAAAKVFTEANWEIGGISRSRPGESLQNYINWWDQIDLSNWHEIADWFWANSNQGKSYTQYDIVFMTHGVQTPCHIRDINLSIYQDIVSNNMLSAVILSRFLLEYEAIAPGGLVAFCSSIQATQPRAGRGLYAMAKAGLEGFMKTMAVEMAPTGRAVALRLGQMDGTMKGITFSDEARAAIEERTPLPWVSFEDTARLVAALYKQPSLSGEVIEISSMHKYSIWPKVR